MGLDERHAQPKRVAHLRTRACRHMCRRRARRAAIEPACVCVCVCNARAAARRAQRRCRFPAFETNRNFRKQPSAEG